MTRSVRTEAPFGGPVGQFVENAVAEQDEELQALFRGDPGLEAAHDIPRHDAVGAVDHATLGRGGCDFLSSLYNKNTVCVTDITTLTIDN